VNPAMLTQVGYCPMSSGGQALAVTVAGNYAYVADWVGGLLVVDIANPAAPTEAGFYDTPGSANGVAVAGNQVYVADYLYLGIYDVSHCVSPIIPRAPDSLVIAFLPDQNRFRLDWARVTRDLTDWPLHVDRYVILRNDSLNEIGWDSIGVPAPPDTTVFVDSTADASVKYFYQVKAVKN